MADILQSTFPLKETLIFLDVCWTIQLNRNTESNEYYNQQVYNPRGGHSADPQRQNEQYRRLVENNKRGDPRLEDETSFSDSQPSYLNWKKK